MPPLPSVSITSPWLRLSRHTLGTSLAVLILDQVTKLLALHLFSPTAPLSVIPGFFRLVLVKNTGAAWGMFSGSTGILTLISAIAGVGLLVFFPHFCEDRRERGVAMSLLLGGIFGNLIDRGLRKEVIDFLSFHLGRFEWPAFNIADSAICIGISIFLLSSIRFPPPTADETEKSPPASELQPPNHSGPV